MQEFSYPSGPLNGGLENKFDDTLIQQNQWADAQNIILDNKNIPQKREALFSQTAPGAEWKTGMVDGDSAPAFASTLYKYQKRTGAQYAIAFAAGKISYSQDLHAWTDITPAGVVFSTALKMNFTTFQDMLIASNGSDKPYYWDGSLPKMQLIGAPVLTASTSGSTVDTGTHTFFETYEGSDTNIYYWQDITPSIDSSGKDILISNIPLGSQYNFASGKRMLWVSAANSVTEFYLFGNASLSDTATTATLSVADSTITTWEKYNATYLAGKSPIVPANVAPPAARFPSVFKNTLFLGCTAGGPSEVVWSEQGSFEIYPGANADDANVDDGEFITGLKTFKAANQLLVWKKTSMYGLFEASDTFLMQPISQVGCTFSDSIQEANIHDEYGERSTMFFANNDGVWEWSGSTNRLVSHHPTGSSIQALWENVRQREVDFMKDAKATQGELNHNSASGSDWPNNWAAAEAAGVVDIQNVFQWSDTTGISDDSITAMCWDATNKKLWVARNGTQEYGDIGYYTWDATLKQWHAITLIISTVIGYGDTTKMEFDPVTNRLYGITKNGQIWRTNAGATASGDLKGYDVSSLIGVQAIISDANGGSPRIVSDANIHYTDASGNEVLGIGHVAGENGSPPAFNAQNYVFIPTYTKVTNTSVFNGNPTMLYCVRGDFAYTNLSGSLTETATQINGNGGTAMLPPGLYSFAVRQGVSQLELTMRFSFNYANNAEMKIINGYLYFVQHKLDSTSAKTNGGAFKVLNRINLTTWAIDGAYSQNVGRGFIYFGDPGIIAITGGGVTIYEQYYNISYSDETNGFTSFLKGVFINGVITTTYIASTQQYEFLRHREYLSSPNAYFVEARNALDASMPLGTKILIRGQGLTQTGTYFTASTIEQIDAYNNINWNIPLMLSAKDTLLFFNNTGLNLYEAKITDTAIPPAIAPASQLLDAQGTPKAYNAAILIQGIEAGVPDMIISQANTFEVSTLTAPVSNSGTITVANGALFTVGMKIDIFPAASRYGGTAETTANQITAVSGNTITLTTSVSAASANDLVFINGQHGAILVDAYWRGVVGNYTLSGQWLFTGVNAVDMGDEVISLDSLVVQQLNVNPPYSTINYYLKTDTAANTLGIADVPNMQQVVPGSGLDAVFIVGAPVEYVHEYFTLYYDVSDLLSSSLATGFKSPAVDTLVLNWTNVIGGTTAPRTEITSIVHKNRYYISFIENNEAATDIFSNEYNNTIAMLDRLKRWTIWRGRGCFAGNFMILNDYLYWSDSYVGPDGIESDYIYRLTAPATMGAYSDTNVTTGGQEAIDAWFVTKNFDRFAEYDSPRKKKIQRRMFITSNRFILPAQQTAYQLLVGYRKDDLSDTFGNRIFTELTLNVGDITPGKINERLDFKNEQPGKRHQYRFRNNQTGQDIGLLEFTLEGRIAHRRD